MSADDDRMGWFDRFSDGVNRAWSSATWWNLCAVGVCGWIIGGVVSGALWRSDRYHLWLNSPTTALTFLGVFIGLNGALRFERAVNKRLLAIEKRLGIVDPVGDEGQHPEL